MTSTRKTVRGLALAATVAVVLTACSSQGGAQNQASNDAAAGGNVGGESYTIQMVTHEQAGDTFWDKIRAGAEDAAKAHNVKLQYSNNENAPEQATLVQNAIDSKVAGIAVTMATPDAIGPEVEKAIAAGIPTVAFNSGISDYAEYGAQMYFGSDEQLAGKTAGERIAEDGGQKALCVIQAQGSVALETRCAGVKAGLANTENIQVNGADLPSVQSTIASKLQQDPSITHIVTLGAPIALAALQAKTDASNTSVKIITFDLNADAAKAIKDGTIMFSIDQQPYVQGYMAVASLWLNITNGNDLGGGGPVLTGPSIVDSTNIDAIVPFAENNKR